MQNLIVICVFITLGVLTRRLCTLPDKTPFWINRFIIFVVLPAVILRQVPRLELRGDVLLPVVSPWIFFACTLAAVHLVGQRMQWSRDVRGALLLLVPLGNTSYLGYPMTQAFYGAQGMPYAIVFDQIGNFLLLAILVPFVQARFGGQPTQASWRFIGKRILSFPPFIVLCVTLLLLRDVALPDWLDTALLLIGMTMAPLAMFIVGLQLSAKVARELRAPLSFALGMKLLASPLVALVLCLIADPLIDGDALAAQVTVFEAAMPTMVTAAIMAMAAGLAPRLCTATVGLGLCLSLITLPLWYAITHWLLV